MALVMESLVAETAKAMVLISEDGLRKFRFDFIKEDALRPIPTHAHLQEFRNGKWRDAVKGVHKIFPKND